MADSGGFLNVVITTTFNSFSTERRFAGNISVGQLKEEGNGRPLLHSLMDRFIPQIHYLIDCLIDEGVWCVVENGVHLLEGITGAGPASMQLTLLKKDGSLVGALLSNDVSLHSAGIENGMTIEVTDPSLRVGQFEDTSQVKKFELSEEEYANRSDSLRAFKQRNKVGEFSQADKAKELAEKEEESKKMIAGMKVGERCLVTVQGQAPKRGTLMYTGKTYFKEGLWVGVKYDEPLGKHDGSVQGKRYFECPAKYGAFVKPENVTIGDYPEENFLHEL